MFGTRPHVNPLAARKQLLIAESELNRAELLQDCQALAVGGRDLIRQFSSIGSMASSTMSLVAGLTAFAGGNSKPAVAPSSWLQKILSGVRLASTIWLLFRARRSDPAKK